MYQVASARAVFQILPGIGDRRMGLIANKDGIDRLFPPETHFQRTGVEAGVQSSILDGRQRRVLSSLMGLSDGGAGRHHEACVN